MNLIDLIFTFRLGGLSKNFGGEKCIYIFYSTTRIGQEFPFSQPTGLKYYVLLPEIIVPEKQTQKSWENQQKLRKSAEFGFIFQEILFPV